MSSSIRPVYQFTTTRKSVLDTVLTDKDKRRPAYATLTHDAVTTLYRVDRTGSLEDVAEVQWEVRGEQDHVVSLHGQSMGVNDFLSRSKGLFSGSSRVFTAGGLTCKWRETEVGGAVHIRATGLRSWVCHDTTSSSSAASLVAVLSPPQFGALKAEVTVYERGRDILDAVICTAILLSANKSEWRKMRSPYTRDTLERVLKADAQGLLPPYSPTAAAERRSSLPAGRRRRPNTAPSLSEPPPYTSRLDISTPH